MSVTHSHLSDKSSNSPSKPEESMHVSNMPEEGSVCALLNYENSDDSRSEVSWEEIKTDKDDPAIMITEDMLEEEKKLHAQGVEQEKKRIESQAELLNKMSKQTKEKQYERLKFLLNKSTMYTKYLVERITKQKEEEEIRKARIMKRKLNIEQVVQLKKEQNEKSGEKVQTENREEISDDEIKQQGEVDTESTQKKSSPLNGRNKRKINETLSPELNQESEAKRQKKTVSDISSPRKPSLNDNIDPVVDPQKDSSEIDHQNQIINEAKDRTVDEPELIEKAKTFGVVEEEGERRINGEEVSFLQPKLMDGGVLRSYQLEGYSWLKVLYENGVNGILADEMGLGKTVQCVAILSHLVYMGIPGPFLVCAPLSTIPNWFAEFQRFSPKVPTILYHGDKIKRTHLAKRIRRKHQIREGVFVQPVVITSYEVAMIDRKYLANHEWKYLIVDEGHRIKNTHCRLIRELRMYRSTHRLLLTGTPLQNNLAELWSLLNFILPEIFDDLGSFEAWFDVNCINEAEAEEQIVQQERAKSILSMLHQILTPFMLRRLKSDVDINIPPKKEILVFAPMTKQQMDFYSALVDKTIFNFINKKNDVNDTIETTASGRPKRRSAAQKIDYSLLLETDEEKKLNKSNGGGKSSKRRWTNMEQEEEEFEGWAQALCDMNTQRVNEEKKQKTSQITIKMRNVMMQLRKCCNHPYLLEHPIDPKTGDLALDEGVITTSGKMLILDKMLAELKKRGHKVLIFSQMTRMLDLIEDFCQIRKYDFLRLDGGTHVDDRRDSMNVFNDKNSDKFLFLLSTKAGGLGINLTGADTVIIYDSDWNPQSDLQAQDRCHRIGQTKPVVVYRFVTANTIDQKIIERAAAKRKLEKMIIHKGKFKSGNFMTKAKPISPEELQDLLHSKDHESEMIGNSFAISKSELNSLLDRSDLLDKWKEMQKTSPDQDKKEVENFRSSRNNTNSASIRTASVKKKTSATSKSKFFKVMDTEESDCSNLASEETKDNDSLPVTPKK